MKTSADSTAVATTPSLTLKEAVINAVKELKVKGGFSVHDVTTEIREAVNAGEFTLPGLENPNPNSQSGIKYWVKNEDVKAIIESLENDGTLANLGLTNVDMSGPFRVFEFSTPTTPSAGVPASTPPSVNAPNPTQSPLVQRIEAYLSKGTPVTLKQIQSALKINGVTCKDLEGIVAGISGYVVTPGTTDCYSTYTVDQQ